MKKMWFSKTFWLAVIQAVVGVVAYLETQYPGVGLILVGKSVVDILLRYMTVEPVTMM